MKTLFFRLFAIIGLVATCMLPMTASNDNGSSNSNDAGGWYHWNEGQDECWGTVWVCARVEPDEQ